VKLTDDVKQRKQKHFKLYRTAKQKITNKENLARFLHRGKPRILVTLARYALVKFINRANRQHIQCVSQTVVGVKGYDKNNIENFPQKKIVLKQESARSMYKRATFLGDV